MVYIFYHHYFNTFSWFMRALYFALVEYPYDIWDNDIFYSITVKPKYHLYNESIHHRTNTTLDMLHFAP